MKNDSVFISLAVKVAAIMLLLITAFAAITGSVAFAYMADTGYYVESFEEVAGDRYNDLMNKYQDSDIKIRYEVEHFMYRNKINIILWTVIALLVSVVLFVYLMYAAGRKRNMEGVTLNYIDRIPLDIYTSLLLIFLIICVSFAGNTINYATLAVQIIITVPLIVMFYIIILSYLMTIAVRFKTGGLFRNTLIFIILKYLLKGIVFFGESMMWMIRRLPLIWKSIICFLIYVIFSTVLNVFLINGGGTVLFFWFVFNTALLSLICVVNLQLSALKKGGEKLAAGNLSYKIPTDHLLWNFRSHAENLNEVGEGMQRAVDERMKSERFKTELITNVSHDIKTPLTSIINYVDLLKKEDLQNEAAAGYIEVLDRQSARLKKLTEDLVEASKASIGSVAVKTERTDVSELLSQCIAEYSERFNASALKPVIMLPDEPTYIEADGRLLWRILDNLFGNICKYSLAGTRIYFSVETSEMTVSVILRNISREPLNLSPDELMERFVRGDISRNTEGSGLGLSIARSLTEIQRGTLSIDIDGDLFKAVLVLPRSR